MLVLLCTSLAAPVAWAGVSSQQFSPTLYWFCQSSSVPPAYTSTVVVTVASGTTNEVILPQIVATKRDIERSFADFLAKVHGYTGLSSCLSSESQYWMESNRNQRLEALRTHGLQIVETDWKYGNGQLAAKPASTSQPAAAVTPAKPTAPVAAAPVAVKPAAAGATTKPATGTPAPAGQVPYAFCFGEVTGLHQTVYFGVPFEAQVPKIPAWSTAYKEFLRNRYKFAGLVHCQSLKSQPEAQQQQRKVKDRYVAHWKVVETGWKYQ